MTERSIQNAIVRAAAEPIPLFPPMDAEPPALRLTLKRTCRYCGCTDDEACWPACWWVGEDVCSSCGDAA